MKVIINGRFLIHRVTGVERYAREICAQLDSIVSPGEFEMAVPPETKDLPDYKNIKIIKAGHFHNRLWEQLSFPIYVAKRRAVSLNLCNVAPLLSPGIVAIHDVKIKATPQYFSKKFILWYNLLFSNIVRRSKKIITVSEFSKSEIEKYYNANSDKISVIPSTWQHYGRISCDEDTLKKYNLEKDNFYFAMGSLEPNKNFKWIAEVAKGNPNVVFAVAGSINETVFADGLGFECPENMKLLGYVSDGEAKTLMRDCRAFLFPTFYEGFGLPPLEALSAGAKRIIVSDTEVMHEVYGACALYVDPYNADVDLDALCRETVEDREAVLAKYSWEKSAQKLYEVCREVTGEKNV